VSDYFLIVKDEEGNVVRLEPIDAEPVWEDDRIVGYLRRESGDDGGGGALPPASAE
jgi:hypothetical protein